MTMSDYNGWTNYATWRVNLEILDGRNIEEYFDTSIKDLGFYNLAIKLREEVEDIIEETSDGIAKDYALAFLNEVNWTEIAKHMIDEYSEAA